MNASDEVVDNHNQGNKEKIKTKTKCPGDFFTNNKLLIAVIGGALTLAIICFCICWWKKCQNPETREEQPQFVVNELYGTYYNGVEYNTVSDTNSEYGLANSDSFSRSNSSAVIKDNNSKYCK